MKKILTPRRIFFRILSNNKISCNEYISGFQHAVLPPFKQDNEEAIQQLRKLIDDFKHKTKRDVIGAQKYLPELFQKLGIQHEDHKKRS